MPVICSGSLDCKHEVPVRRTCGLPDHQAPSEAALSPLSVNGPQSVVVANQIWRLQSCSQAKKLWIRLGPALGKALVCLKGMRAKPGDVFARASEGH